VRLVAQLTSKNGQTAKRGYAVCLWYIAQQRFKICALLLRALE
jgi:hypothetical protein